MVISIEKLYLIAKCVLINKENKILILKRTDYKKNGTGNLWDFPGGSVDSGEEINDAITREAEEEIQVKLNKTGVLSIESGNSNEGDGYWMFVLFYSKDFDLREGIKLSHEHSEYKWISVDEIENYKFLSPKKRLDEIKEFLKSN